MQVSMQDVMNELQRKFPKELEIATLTVANRVLEKQVEDLAMQLPMIPSEDTPNSPQE